jgi:anti-sigma-K factor RskA
MREEMATHGPGCERCIRLVAEYSEVAGWLTTLAEPMPMSAGAGIRLSQRIAGPEPVEPVEAEGHRVAPIAREARRSRSAASRRRAAAVAVAASLVAAGVIGYRIAPHPGGVRVAAFAAPPGQSLAVAYEPGGRRGVIIGSNVPAPPSGRVYELWFRPRSGAPMRPAGTFLPMHGRLRATVTLGPSFTALAVSVEPRGGSPQPTSEPVFVTTVSRTG